MKCVKFMTCCISGNSASELTEDEKMNLIHTMSELPRSRTENLRKAKTTGTCARWQPSLNSISEDGIATATSAATGSEKTLKPAARGSEKILKPKASSKSRSRKSRRTSSRIPTIILPAVTPGFMF